MPPYILCLLDSGEVRLFPNLASLESQIEAIDVENREYSAYDSLGREVELSVDTTFDIPRAKLTDVMKAEQLRGWIFDCYHENREIAEAKELSEMIEVLKRAFRYRSTG